MSGRAHLFQPMGPLSPDGRTHIGVEMQGSGLPALPVVMVWVPERIHSKPEKLKELQEQTESAVRLNHPNVIRVRGLEKLDDGWARIVEFADADSLRKMLEAGRGRVDMLWPAIAAAIVADACLGVHHAHETGEAKDPKRPQLHGGIRPDVLLVNYKGLTKVTGYGAAAFAPEGKDLARDAYTAPEQVLGGREAMTRQTDIYQLGAVLYEALTGVPPFTAEEGLLEQLILTKMPGAHRLADQPELGEIALKAMSKKASDRFATAQEMADALVSSKASPPVSHDVVARWANILIPPSHPEREQRRELIKEAIESTGATEIPEDLKAALEALPPEDQSSVVAPPPPIPPAFNIAEPPAKPPPPVAEAAPPAPTPTPTPPAPAPAATPPAPTPAPAPEPAKPAPANEPKPAWLMPNSRPPEVSVPPPDHSRRNLAIGVGLAIAITAWFGYVKSTQGPTPIEEAVARANAAAAAKDAGSPVVDAGASAVAMAAGDGGTADGGAESASAAMPDAGTTPVANAVVDAGPPAAEKLVLDVETDPPMKIKIDGDSVGSGVVHASLPPGRHRVEASDKALRIFAAREVTLEKNHQEEKITVGKAQLAFDVPAGSTVTVDGKVVGTAPLQPVELYAGTHEAIVEYNEAKTVQKVPITADFNVTLTVHAN